MTSMRFLSSSSLLLLAALAASACATGPGAPRTGLVGNRCNTDADCPGSACDVTQRICVSSGATTEVVLSASPPGGRITPFATTTSFAPRVVQSGATGSVDIPLRAPRRVYGTVVVPGATAHDPGVPISATIRFRRQDAAPSEPVVTVQAGGAMQLGSGGGAYTADLVPGTYDVLVTPTDLGAHPPYVIQGQLVPADESGADLRFDIVYSSGTVVSGTLLDSATGQPLPNVTVRIVDPSRSDALISTVATTRATTPVGSFALVLAPGTPANSDWELEVASPRGEGSGGATGRLVYRISRTGLGALSAYDDLAIRLPGTAGFGRADSGACNVCVRVEATVEGVASNGAAAPLAGAAVDLRAENVLGELPPGHRAWFEAQVETGSDGSFRAELLPGGYEAIITPANLAQFAVTSVALPVTMEQRGRVLTVRRLIPYTGTVVDIARGVPQGNVQIEAIPVADMMPSAMLSRVQRLARQAQALTSADGMFRLELDEGPYRIVARPAPGSGFATQILPQTEWVRWQADPRPDNEGPLPGPMLAIALRPPIVITGLVSDAASSPVGGAVVRAFARIREGGAPLDVELGTSTADDRGRYTLLLSPDLGR